MEFRNNITNINDLHVGEVYMQLYIVIDTQLLSDFDLKLTEEGFRNFDSKTEISIEEELSSEEPEAIWTLKFGRIG